jgi:hypothetical protein
MTSFTCKEETGVFTVTITSPVWNVGCIDPLNTTRNCTIPDNTRRATIITLSDTPRIIRVLHTGFLLGGFCVTLETFGSGRESMMDSIS